MATDLCMNSMTQDTRKNLERCSGGRAPAELEPKRGRSAILIIPNLLLWRRDIGDGQVPVGQQNLEPRLFLAFVSLLVRPELLDKRLFLRIRGCRHGGVLERDRDAIVPSR